MTKYLVVGIAGWILVHVGLVLVGLVIGGAGVGFALHGDTHLHCQEDEVAVHGGLADWYDPDASLECVNIEEWLIKVSD